MMHVPQRLLHVPQGLRLIFCQWRLTFIAENFPI